MSNRSHKAPQNGHLSRQPQVADPESVVPVEGKCLDLSIDPRTEELIDLGTYQVFMKRNLSWQTPPENLLASIHERIDRIKAGND